MRLIKIVTCSYLLLAGFSCSRQVISYHHVYDKETILDGEIWNGSLYVFFSDNKDINKDIIKKSLRSRALAKELNRILNMIEKEQSVTVFDDNYYEYAFIINSRDTLYTNNKFSYWKYKNLQMGKVDTSLGKLLE